MQPPYTFFGLGLEAIANPRFGTEYDDVCKQAAPMS